MSGTDLVYKRKERGLTQGDVAKGCGISRQYYSFIENGKRNISIKAAKKIAAYYGLDWKDFFEDKKPQEEGLSRNTGE